MDDLLGNDAFDGSSPNLPLRTLQQALLPAAPKALVHIGAGQYQGTLVVDVPGVELRGAGPDVTTLVDESDAPHADVSTSAPCANGTVDFPLSWLNGSGGSDANPLFLAPNTVSVPQPADGSDHPLPDLRLGPDSPAIDTGDPGAPFGAERQPNGGRVNPGAHGGRSAATPGADAAAGECP